MIRRRACYVLPSGTLRHEGPLQRRGVSEVGDRIVDRYVCIRCGGELLALNRDVETLRETVAAQERLARYIQETQ